MPLVMWQSDDGFPAFFRGGKVLSGQDPSQAICKVMSSCFKGIFLFYYFLEYICIYIYICFSPQSFPLSTLSLRVLLGPLIVKIKKKSNWEYVLSLRPSIYGEIIWVQHPNRAPGHLPLVAVLLPSSTKRFVWLCLNISFLSTFFFNIYIHKDSLSAFVIAHTLEGIMMNPDILHFEQTDSRETGIRRNPERGHLQSTDFNSCWPGLAWP